MQQDHASFLSYCLVYNRTMVIKNETTGKTLADSAIKAKSWKDKAFGLILHKTPTTMLFQTRLGIHTFFMRYPIDVAIVDKDNKVRAIKENLKPNRIFLWNVTYDTIIEFPDGTLKKTKLGDTLSF